MRKLLGLLMVMAFGFSSVAMAYEGATKFVAAMASPNDESQSFSPLWLVPSYALTPSKPVLQLLNRMPKPTLSAQRIREEKPGFSLGTKSVIRFQKSGRIN